MCRRVIDIFDEDGNGEVDFKEFIMGLSHFRCHRPTLQHFSRAGLEHKSLIFLYLEMIGNVLEVG